MRPYHLIILAIIAGIVHLSSNAADEKAKSSNNETTKIEEKKYTESEFRIAVKEATKKELEKTLNKLGKGSLIELSHELLKKEEELNLKELELKKQDEQLLLGQKDFETRLVKFQTEQARIIGCMDTHDKEKEKRVNHMVESISAMKPQVAADVLSVQEADISVRILGLLGPEKVSKIFNLMNKEISARLQKQYLDMKK